MICSCSCLKGKKMSSSSPTILALVSVIVLCGSSIMSATAACEAAPLLFAFGDSNTDTGGSSVVSGTIPEPPEGRTFFNQPTGRICDGRLIIDFLCESLGTKYLTPYLELFSPDFSNGANFALAGSDTLRRGNSEVPFTLNYQIAEFSLFRNISLRYNLISAYQFSRALYLVDIGQNDIDGNIDARPVDQLLPIVVSNIKEAIQSVYALGGRNFWIHNTGPVGCLPANVAKRNSSTPVDAYGCLATRNEAAATFNAALEKMCEELRGEMAHATIVYVDIFSIKLDLIVNATSYGLDHPFMGCVDKATKRVCSEAEGKSFISWDGVHYTEAANMLVATKILSTNFSTPPNWDPLHPFWYSNCVPNFNF